jgi:hypothetical protein
MPEIYDVGDLVELSCTFTDKNLIPADPSTIALQIKPPSGSVVEYTYALGQITKIGVGLYVYNLSISEEGTHNYRWVGGGAVQAAGENCFRVRTMQTK